MEIKGKVKAWLPEYNQSGFSRGLEAGEGEVLIENLTFLPLNRDMSDVWALVGEAEITVNLIPINEIKGNLAEALRKQIKELQAETYVKVREMEEKIQSLLAIGHDDSIPAATSSSSDDIPF